MAGYDILQNVGECGDILQYVFVGKAEVRDGLMTMRCRVGLSTAGGRRNVPRAAAGMVTASAGSG